MNLILLCFFPIGILEEIQMSHKFIPKNYIVAWYYSSVPFYKLSDLLLMKPLAFNDGEVTSVVKYSKNALLMYQIFYKTKNFEGYFFHKGKIDEKVFGDVAVISKKQFDDSGYLKEMFKIFFSLKSPILWSVLFTVLISYICSESYLFPGYLKPEAYANTYCRAECVKKASLAWNALTLVIGTTVSGLSIGLVFFFFISSKIKNSQKYNFVRFTSLFLILINLAISYAIIAGGIEKNAYKKAILIYRLAYNPEYFKDSNNRKIASEIMGKEIKEKK